MAASSFELAVVASEPSARCVLSSILRYAPFSSTLAASPLRLGTRTLKRSTAFPIPEQGLAFLVFLVGVLFAKHVVLCRLSLAPCLFNCGPENCVRFLVSGARHAASTARQERCNATLQEPRNGTFTDCRRNGGLFRAYGQPLVSSRLSCHGLTGTLPRPTLNLCQHGNTLYTMFYSLSGGK